jgi:3-hydroxyacyl-[acyl-carrier-protein] dehydratase
MILKDSFYTINRQLTGEGISGGETMGDLTRGVAYEIRLNESHFIYQAHFPSEPITPGVCIIQIAKELLEESLRQHLEIKAVKNVKFLHVISPMRTPLITFEFGKMTKDDTAKTCQVQVLVSAAEALLAKLSFICQQR